MTDGEARKGRCPRPIHTRSGVIIDECPLCSDTGWLAFCPWSEIDRNRLTTLWTQGMSATAIANKLDRPVSDVFTEARLLGLQDQDSPSFIANIKPMGREMFGRRAR